MLNPFLNKKKQSRYEIIKRHDTFVKYGILVINVLFMIVAVRAFINYSYINENIDKEYQNIAYIIQRNAYVENFHRSYLQSEYAAYFLGHENNRMYDNEILVRIQTKEEAENQETQTEARTNA
ncbi:hypothetical protein GW750_08820 [bacterium]|nr:hypothetical protein [bacterium]